MASAAQDDADVPREEQRNPRIRAESKDPRESRFARHVFALELTVRSRRSIILAQIVRRGVREVE